MSTNTIVVSKPVRTLSWRIRASRSDGGAPEPGLSSPRVPIEIIDRIIELVVLSFLDASFPGNPDFHDIKYLTLVSSCFRQIVFRHFYRDIWLTSKLHWTGIYRLLDAQEQKNASQESISGFAWVKSIGGPAHVLGHKLARLNRLMHIQCLCIDMGQEGLSTQRPRLEPLFASICPTAASSKLTHLTLDGLPRIDVVLLRLIARTFPLLTHLYLSCTERLVCDCCLGCFRESLECTIHSPIPDDYPDVDDLADAFGTALKPLVYLNHLHLGVFLSNEALLYPLLSRLWIDRTEPPYLLGPELEIAVKTTRSRELKATLMIAQKLKGIESIGWSSFCTRTFTAGKTENKPMEEQGDSANSEVATEDTEEYEGRTSIEHVDDSMKTIIWILRSKGRIRVRRSPW